MAKTDNIDNLRDLARNFGWVALALAGLVASAGCLNHAAATGDGAYWAFGLLNALAWVLYARKSFLLRKAEREAAAKAAREAKEANLKADRTGHGPARNAGAGD